jgi:hypothetical protein
MIAMPKSKPSRKPVIKAKPPRRLIVDVLDDGKLMIHHNGVTQTESPTLLRIAALIVERQLGIRE